MVELVGKTVGGMELMCQELMEATLCLLVW